MTVAQLLKSSLTATEFLKLHSGLKLSVGMS